MRRAGTRRGLTLVEVVVALALLALVVAGFASLTSSSLQQTSRSRPAMIAQQTAERVIEHMRADSKNAAFSAWWTSTTKTNIGGKNWATGNFPDSTPGEFLAAWTNAAGTGLLDRKVVSYPSDANAFLRVRFLNESEYAALWGLASPVDLDPPFDDATDIDAGATDPTAAYSMLPVLVEVRWRDEGGERRYQLKTVLMDAPQLDPTR